MNRSLQLNLMEIKLSPKIKKEDFDILKEYGYKSEKDFVEDALRRRILELKKVDFSTKVKDIQERMRKKRIKEGEILKDFDKFYHQK